MTLVCLLLTLHCQPQQQQPPALLVEGITAELDGSIEHEYSRLRRLTTVTSEDIDALSEAMKAPLRKAAVEYARQAPLGLDRPTVLDEKLGSLLTQQVAKTTGEADAAKYKEDLATRRRFWMDALIAGTVVAIDHRVCLTSEQAREVHEILRTQWLAADQYSLQAMAKQLWCSPELGPFPHGFPRRSIREILNRPQVAAWDFHEFMLPTERDEMLQLVAEEDKADKSMRWFVRLTRHNAMVLAEHSGADAKQRDHLLLASKGATRAGHAARSEAFRTKQSGKSLDAKRWELLHSSAQELAWFHKLTPWARSAMTDEQRNVFDREHGLRAKRTHRAFALYMVAELSRRAPFTADEQAATFRLLMDVPVDDRAVWTSARRYASFTKIPDSKWSEFLSAEPLAAVRKWINYIRQTVPGTKE